MMAFYSALFVLSVCLVAPKIVAAQSITCPFDGCQCLNVSSSINVICLFNRTYEVARPGYFPQRNPSSSITVINRLFISRYNFRSIPADIFSGLSINFITMVDNGLATVGVDSFRGIKNLKYLIINDLGFESFAENSTAPLRESLNTLDLSDTSLSIPNFEKHLVELKQLGNLNSLILSSNSLANITSKHLSLFPNLRQLSLVLNGMSEFQDQQLFQGNKLLSSLDMRKNNIQDLSKVLPALRQVETTLTELSLAENKLESIQEMPLSKLQKLFLPSNHIKTIAPNAFSTLSDLRHLDLSGNQLVALDTAVIAPLTKLTALLLSSNFLRTIPDISNMADLSFLDMGNQNDQLKLQDFAFSRLKFNNQMDINLDNNQLSGRINDKAFCSRTKRTNDIRSISINYESIKTLNTCVLKQLRQEGVAPNLNMIVTGASSNGNYDACSCDLENYATASNVNLTGICDRYTASCKQVQMLDTCSLQPQYTCGSTLLRQSLVILISLLALSLLI